MHEITKQCRVHPLSIKLIICLTLPFVIFGVAAYWRWSRNESVTLGKPDSVLQRYLREVKEEECSVNITVPSRGGTLNSPDYPKKYPSNTDCRWLLTAPEGSNIVLKIVSLDLERHQECELDYLQVYVGGSTFSPSLDRLCGTVKDKIIETNSSQVLVAFHSDPSFEDNGFQIEYYLQSLSGCPSTKKTNAGTVSSPEFPNNYPDDTDCWTLISIGADKRILLQFETLELEFDENCTYDYVELFDGSSIEAISLGRFCSSNKKDVIQSSTNELLLHFHSDHLVNKKGFQAQYSSVSSWLKGDIGDLGGCLLESDERNGSIASPNYPQKYPRNAQCNILITAPKDQIITVIFDVMNLEIEANCSYDYLEIKDVSMQDSGLSERFCGKANEAQNFTTTSNVLFITFQSDDFGEFTGFKGRYYFHPNSAEEHEIETTTPLRETSTVNPSSMNNYFLEKPQNATLVIGAPYMLECVFNDPVAKIRWLKDEQFLAGNTPLPGIKLVANNTLWIQSMNKGLTGVYTCAAVLPEGTHYAKAWLKLENQELENEESCSIVLRKIPRNAAFTEGEFAYLECLAAGNQVQIEWQKNYVPLNQTKHITVWRNGFLSIDNVSLDDAGIYTCIITDLVAKCQKRVNAVLSISEKAKLQEICGKPKIVNTSKTKPRLDHGKIIGGHNTVKGAYPWQVMLWEPQLKSFCGATVLNERWILTAAHCFLYNAGMRWDNIVIKLGKYNRETEELEEFVTSIADPSAIVIHPSYNKQTFDNDIALVQLKDHVKFTDYILPICLAERETIEKIMAESSMIMGTVTGWGKLKEGGPVPKYLQEIQMPIVNQKTCINSTLFPVTRNMFCAGYAQEIVGDSCQGDSGGSFIINYESKWYLHGIVSWGEGCGEKNKYGFYTKISNYLPWIKGIMKS